MSEIIRVLVLEDNCIARIGIRVMLASLPGVRLVAEATTVREALEAYSIHRPDVAILDLVMSGGSGLDVLRHIRAGSRPCVVMMYSSGSHGTYEALCLQAGADHYFEKGRDSDRIIALINSFRSTPSVSR